MTLWLGLSEKSVGNNFYDARLWLNKKSWQNWITFKENDIQSKCMPAFVLHTLFKVDSNKHLNL